MSDKFCRFVGLKLFKIMILGNIRRSALVWWDELTVNKKIELISKQWGYDKYWKKNYNKIVDSDKIMLYQHYA